MKSKTTKKKKNTTTEIAKGALGTIWSRKIDQEFKINIKYISL